MTVCRIRSIAIPVASLPLRQDSVRAPLQGVESTQHWQRASRLSLALTLFVLLLNGCQSGPVAAPAVTYTPHASGVGRMTAAPAMSLPPAPVSLHADRVSEHALRHQTSLTPAELPVPTSVIPPENGLAPADTSASGTASSQPAPDTKAPLLLAGPAAAAAIAASVSSADPRPTPQAAFEIRLAALEQEWQTKQQAFETLQSHCQLQTDELTQVRAALESARREIERLEKTVGTQHQRDVASLEQLSSTLEQLLKSESASSPLESP